MDILHIEVTMLAMLGMSVFFFGLALLSGNADGAVQVLVPMTLIAAAAIVLASSDGRLKWQDAFLIAGLAFWMAAARKRGDTETMIVLCTASAVPLALWVFYYNMSSTEYAAAYALSVIAPAIFAVCLMTNRPKKERAPEARSVGVPA